MSNFYIGFWAVMVFLSIGWYAVLLVFVGFRGGREIVEMTQGLKKGDKSNFQDTL